jgi:glucose/arabinose dehydrogenase
MNWMLLAPLIACGSKDDGEVVAPSGFVFQAMDGFELPPDTTDMVRHEDTLLALDLAGQVVAYDFDGSERGSLQIDVWNEEACGLLSLVFDPDFNTNGLVYYGACESQWVSGVWRAHLDLSTLVVSDVVEVLKANEPEATRSWHNVGWLGFDTDGALVAQFGDKTVSTNGQNTDTILGSVVRVYPNKEPGIGGYTPHPDNPFATEAGHDAIMAWGFRSPWTGAWDRHGGLWVGDVGSNGDGWEELNHVRPGQNHGWPDHEGDCGADCAGTTAPPATWPHTSNHAFFGDDPDIVATVKRVVWVAPGFEGTGTDPYGGRLTDKLIYGDLCMGWIRSFTPQADGSMTDDAFLGHLASSAWVQAPDGSLLAAQLSACGSKDLTHTSQMFRLEYRD